MALVESLVVVCHPPQKNFGMWEGPTNSTLETIRGDGDAQTLPVVIEFIWTFCTQKQWGYCNIYLVLAWSPYPLAPLASTRTCSHLKSYLVTAHKRSLRRLCFYRCVSVHRGGGFSILGGSPSWGGFSIPGGFSILGGVSIPGGCSIPGGSPSGGLLHPRGALHLGGFSIWGGSPSWGVFSIWGVLHPGGVLHRGGSPSDQCAGGMHHSGMHSCETFNFNFAMWSYQLK